MNAPEAIGRSLELRMSPEQLRYFSPLFQEGLETEVETGCSVQEMLTEQFGISADYISARITTLFLNSRAIDDAETALVSDGSVLALSGAMPGLVGATMRRGGYYAAMRSDMSFQNEGIPMARRGRIKVKLFNLLLEELGPRLLARGVLLGNERLRLFVEGQPKEAAVKACSIDSRAVPGDFATIGKAVSPDVGMTRLRVEFEA